ncbi:hypothetical protein FKM82_006919 [Ascaphus truei]
MLDFHWFSRLLHFDWLFPCHVISPRAGKTNSTVSPGTAPVLAHVRAIALRTRPSGTRYFNALERVSTPWPRPKRYSYRCSWSRKNL